MLEEMMQEALTQLQTNTAFATKFVAQAVTDAAVIDQDADQDGRLDENPDHGRGEQAGSFTIMIYPIWSPPQPPPEPALVLNEDAVVELGLTTAEKIVGHVLAQLT